jgi:hypothetical protein
MIEYFHDIEQGTEEWFALRLGVPTASMFHAIMAKGQGKTRRTYMLKLIGEILTQEQQDNYSNAHMDRGKELEEEARELYSITTGIDVEQCGFIKNGELGYSPDGICEEDGLLEVKTKLPHLQLDVLLKNKIPPEHIPQLQGGLLVSDHEWIDFVSYWPRLPIFIKRMYRDKKIIADIKISVNAFIEEMHETIEKIKRM